MVRIYGIPRRVRYLFAELNFEYIDTGEITYMFLECMYKALFYEYKTICNRLVEIFLMELETTIQEQLTDEEEGITDRYDEEEMRDFNSRVEEYDEIVHYLNSNPFRLQSLVEALFNVVIYDYDQGLSLGYLEYVSPDLRRIKVTMVEYE